MTGLPLMLLRKSDGVFASPTTTPASAMAAALQCYTGRLVCTGRTIDVYVVMNMRGSQARDQLQIGSRVQLSAVEQNSW